MKKILKVTFLIMLIVSLFQINSLYALYKNELLGIYSYNIGKWQIKVNNTVVEKDGSTVLELNPSSEYFEFEENSGWEVNKIAPGSIGYMYYNIDASGTDVAVIYEFKIELDKIKEYINNQLISSVTDSVSDSISVSDSVSDSISVSDSVPDFVEIANFQIVQIENYYQKDEEIINNTDISNQKLNSRDETVIHRGLYSLDKIKNGYKNVVKVKVKWIDYNTQDSSIGRNKDLKYSIPIEATFRQYVGEEI